MRREWSACRRFGRPDNCRRSHTRSLLHESTASPWTSCSSTVATAVPIASVEKRWSVFVCKTFLFNSQYMEYSLLLQSSQQSRCIVRKALKFEFISYSHKSVAIKKTKCKGSGCGSVSRAVASDFIGPRFESSHQQQIYIEYLLSTVLKRQQ